MSDIAVPEYVPGPRLAQITPDDNSGAIWVATLLLIIYTAIAMMVRLAIKSSVLGKDDTTLAAGTFFHAMAVIAVSVALRNGLGKKSFLIEEGQYGTMNQAVFASNLLWLFALAFSKLSAIFLFLRLFARNMRWMFYACWTTAGVIGVWLITSIIALTAGCSPYASVEAVDGATCNGKKGRWTYILVCAILIEIVLQILPIMLVMPLQMKFSRRFPILLAFAFRLPVIAFAIVHLTLVYKWSDASENQAFYISGAIIWAHVELCWSLLSASIPNIKTFMRSFSIGFGIDVGVMTAMHGTADYGLGSRNPFRSRNTVNSNRDHGALESQTGGEKEQTTKRQSASPEAVESPSPPTSGNAEKDMTILRQVDVKWQVQKNEADQ